MEQANLLSGDLKNNLENSRASREKLIAQSNKLLLQYLEEDSPKKENHLILEYLHSKKNTTVSKAKKSLARLKLVSETRINMRLKATFPRFHKSRILPPLKVYKNPFTIYPNYPSTSTSRCSSKKTSSYSN